MILAARGPIEPGDHRREGGRGQASSRALLDSFAFGPTRVSSLSLLIFIRRFYGVGAEQLQEVAPQEKEYGAGDLCGRSGHDHCAFLANEAARGDHCQTHHEKVDGKNPSEDRCATRHRWPLFFNSGDFLVWFFFARSLANQMFVTTMIAVKATRLQGKREMF